MRKNENQTCSRFFPHSAFRIPHSFTSFRGWVINIMKRLKLLIVIFSLALSIPLAYFVIRTYRGLEQEETATLHYFAETLFDKMEGALAEMVQREEGRAIDEFNYEMFPADRPTDDPRPQLSPLSRPPREKRTGCRTCC